MCMAVLVFRGWAVKAADSDGQWSGASTQTLRTEILPSCLAVWVAAGLLWTMGPKPPSTLRCPLEPELYRNKNVCLLIPFHQCSLDLDGIDFSL